MNTTMTHQKHLLCRLAFVLAACWGLLGAAEAQTLPQAPDGVNPIVLGNKRITLITPTLFRLEYAENQTFLDEPTLLARRRDCLLHDGFTVKALKGGQQYEITTSKLRIVLDNDNLPFGQLNTWVHYMFHGKERTITGRNLHSKTKNLNLGGSINTLDGVTHEIPTHDGLLSSDGFYYIIDTGNDVLHNGWLVTRHRQHVQDQYCFVYGDDFHAPFADLGALSGHVPMTRKYMHGVWYSRWYPYDDQYINTLVKGYNDNGFPLDILSMDMDWHKQDATVGIGHNMTKGWTGFDWNRNLIANPQALIQRLLSDSIRVTVNEHPHDGVQINQSFYPEFMRAMGKDPTKKETLLFDASDSTYMRNYLYYTRRENRQYGVAFWWIDWQQDYLYPYIRGTKTRTLSWLNKLFYEDTEQGGLRGANYSRWGGWGDHRHPLYFSGDARSNWPVLAFEVKLSQTSGNQGCYYWIHDTGGFHGGTQPELLVRWTQFSALSAALRVHAARGKDLDRRPWLWGDEATRAMRTAYRLRAELMPYVYSSVRQTHETMLPLNRCMFVDYPTDTMAYNRYNQYLFGNLILAAPITQPGDSARHYAASQEVWFPTDADWYDFFTHERHAAGSVAKVTKDLQTFPMFVKGGNLLPMQPFNRRPASADLKKVVLRVYPGRDGDNNTFMLYEDDGLTRQYEQGAFAKTPLTYQQNNGVATLTIGAAQGSYNGQVQQRSYEVQLCGFAGQEPVVINIPETSIRKPITLTVPLQRTVGTTISVFHGLDGLTLDSLIAARRKGISCIEISLTGLVNGPKALSWDQLKARLAPVKADADKAGIQIWSIHMPYEKECDPSHPDKSVLKKSLEKYRRCIDAVSVLKPHLLLYHPSFYQLEHGRRNERMKIIGQSMKKLDKWGRAIQSETVIENMLGPTIERTDGFERAIGRNPEEMEYIMSVVPSTVGVAVDTNHALDAADMIRRFGQRVHTLHISDGNGLKDRHAMPGNGSVDWNDVLTALYEVGYKGPFLYEVKSHYVTDMAQLKTCYDHLYAQWLKKLFAHP